MAAEQRWEILNRNVIRARLKELGDPDLEGPVWQLIDEGLAANPHSDEVGAVPVPAFANTFTVFVEGTDAAITWICNDPQRSLYLLRLETKEDPLAGPTWRTPDDPFGESG